VLCLDLGLTQKGLATLVDGLLACTAVNESADLVAILCPFNVFF